MPPAWLQMLPPVPDGSVPTIGVALGVSSLAERQRHAGVLHAHGAPARVLHLAWHALIREEGLPHWIPFSWVQLRLQDDRAEAIAGLCRRIARRADQVPYGLIYEGGRLREDGTAELRGREIGLTCATFVLAVFEGAGITLLALDTWTSREEDGAWHQRIVAMLRGTDGVSEAHISGVAAETRCARYRPEEVAAACAIEPRPVSFQDARGAAHEILDTLLPAVQMPVP